MISDPEGTKSPGNSVKAIAVLEWIKVMNSMPLNLRVICWIHAELAFLTPLTMKSEATLMPHVTTNSTTPKINSTR